MKPSTLPYTLANMLGAIPPQMFGIVPLLSHQCPRKEQNRELFEEFMIFMRNKRVK
jgi:hypothetical protein